MCSINKLFLSAINTILGNPVPVFTSDHKDKVMLKKGILVPSYCLKAGVAQKRTKKALFWGNAFFRLTHYKLLESLVVNVVTTNVKKLEAIRGRQ